MLGLALLAKELLPSSLVRQKLDCRGSVLFTFDDGPHPEITPRVLDVLDRYGAKGLFFVPGVRIPRAPELLREILRRGHGLGNHSFQHRDASLLAGHEITADLCQCRREIQQITGFFTRVYRPPKGIVTTGALRAAWKTEHSIVRWSLDSGEYSSLRKGSSADLAQNVLAKIHDRAIILSHDDVPAVPGYLEAVLPRLLDRGIDLNRGLESLRWNS